MGSKRRQWSWVEKILRTPFRGWRIYRWKKPLVCHSVSAHLRDNKKDRMKKEAICLRLFCECSFPSWIAETDCRDEQQKFGFVKWRRDMYGLVYKSLHTYNLHTLSPSPHHIIWVHSHRCRAGDHLGSFTLVHAGLAIGCFAAVSQCQASEPKSVCAGRTSCQYNHILLEGI